MTTKRTCPGCGGKKAFAAKTCIRCYVRPVTVAPAQHGHNRKGKRTPEYRAWAAMKSRCHNENDAGYEYYGGRGIHVFPAWRSRGGFELFLAEIGPRPSPAHSVDRIKNHLGYEPGNVRWATKVVQMRNTRHNRNITIDGRTQCLTAWCRERALPYKVIHHRITVLGFDPIEALTRPVRLVRKKAS